MVLDDHPSVQVGGEAGTEDRWLSGLGLINGLLGADEHGVGFVIIDVPSVAQRDKITQIEYLPASQRKKFRVMDKENNND